MINPPLPDSTRRLYRSAEKRLLGGVARGLSFHLGVEVWLVRLSFVLLALIDGIGIVAYAAFWLFVPLARVPPAERSEPRPPMRATLILGLVVETVVVFGVDRFEGPGGGKWNVLLPVTAVVIGLAMLWRQADDSQRARWLYGSDRRRWAVGRMLIGSLVVLGGITVLIGGRASLASTGRVLLAALALVAGVLLIALPFVLRLFRDLSAERSERIRSQERAEVAALMHDSVLHTLTLIQRSSADSSEVARLARAQERELRTWLYDGGPRPGSAATPETFVQAIKAAVAEVEDLHGVQIEVVTVGDAPLDDRLRACVSATREAAVNAAKYAKGAPITVYAEVEVETQNGRTQSAEVYVRDRGPGFDLDTVASDRMGIRESIIGRMKRYGGRASIRTAPGEGTEVRIEWRRD